MARIASLRSDANPTNRHPAMLLLRAIAAATLLVALLPCQVEEVGGEADVRGAEVERRMKEGKGMRGEAGEKEAEANLTPEQRLARNITSGAGAYCSFQLSVVPAKLMPGQSGTLRVLAALRGNSVLPSPAPLEMVGPTAQGSLMLGALSPQPAGPGRLAAAYLGRPVYDNYAVFEVPVAMAGDAALGSKHVAAVDMRFDLFDGNTAQPIGRFVDRVSMEIEVGRVADPEVRGLARGGSAPPAEAPTTGTPSAAPGAAPVAGLDRPLTGRVLVADTTPATAAPTAAEPPPAESSQPTVDEAGGVPVGLLVGGAVAAVVLGLLLLRRK